MNELVVQDAAGVRTITFNRPSVKNALTLGMRQEFCRVIDAADRDPSVRAIIITGTDPVFTAGVDFKERDPSFDPRQRQFTVNPGRALRAIQTPSVCAVNGACISGGLEIALSATFAVASERARFADTHARLDVVPAWGLTALRPRAVGLRQARSTPMRSPLTAAPPQPASGRRARPGSRTGRAPAKASLLRRWLAWQRCSNVISPIKSSRRSSAG
jgi:enoyl-CoA hydratase